MATTALFEAPAAAVGASQTFHSVLAVVEFDRSARDFLSPASRSAIRMAAGLAAPGGVVTALHVLPPQPRVILGRAAPAPDPAATIARTLERLSRALDAERPGARVDARVSSGHVLDEIDRAAADAGAGLLIAGYQDRPGAYAEGFSFRALLHRASCPVLVVRASAAPWAP